MKFLDLSGLKVLIEEFKRRLNLKADKDELPTKLSELEQDIEFQSKYVLPRTTTTPKTNEITIVESPVPEFVLAIKNITEGIKNEGNVFIFAHDSEYATLDFEIREGQGTFTGEFLDVEGYYAYSHRKVNGERDESGWVSGDKNIELEVLKGDEIRISTSNYMKFKLGEVPQTLEKVLYFNNDIINKETDLTDVFQDIAYIRADLVQKANKSDIPRTWGDFKKEE